MPIMEKRVGAQDQGVAQYCFCPACGNEEWHWVGEAEVITLKTSG